MLKKHIFHMWTKYWMKNIPTRLGDPPQADQCLECMVPCQDSGLIHMYLYCKVGIVHNYPRKGGEYTQ